LNHGNPASWDQLAEMFLVWCRRGVDGFRCDAGYKVPMHAWRYITARVREEFPETIFLLEGLGGSWAATESLLAEGGMQWAYSELFQNYSGPEVAWYLDYALAQSRRSGLYVHYSETHDNQRLAGRGRAWSLLRNRLCALSSVSGAYGFTCGVEWLAEEKVNVHSCGGLAWGGADNIVPEIAALNRLLATHPCFFDDAKLTRLSEKDSPVYALRRESSEGADTLLVLANTDVGRTHSLTLDPATIGPGAAEWKFDLLGQPLPAVEKAENGRVVFHIGPGAVHCLSATETPCGLAGGNYRRARACANFAVSALAAVIPAEQIGAISWRALAEAVDNDPSAFLASLPGPDEIPEAGAWTASSARTRTARLADVALRAPGGRFTESTAAPATRYPRVVVWSVADARRVTLVPPEHWLLIVDDAPFRASIRCGLSGVCRHQESTPTRAGHVAAFLHSPENLLECGGRTARDGGTAARPAGLETGAPPRSIHAPDPVLRLERFGSRCGRVEAAIRFLPSDPERGSVAVPRPLADCVALLTNGRGGMARMTANLGKVHSKYDCVLAANLHATVPVDRHVFVKRVRVWSVADGFITPLDDQNLSGFEAGPPARWRFVANAGDGRAVGIELVADMLEGRNTTVLRFTRFGIVDVPGRDLPPECGVTLTVRVDLEDRNFHWETKRNSGAEHHFASNTRPLAGRAGFEFLPAPDRRLRVSADAGRYHHEAEWCEQIPHPVEQTRGQTATGDAFSPGWFSLPLTGGEPVNVVLDAESAEPPPGELGSFAEERRRSVRESVARAGLPEDDSFGRRLASAVQAFVVRRGEGKTVIAGYPWFLDWGRDSLIAARGLLAAGMVAEVRQLLVTFARFEENGTLPNSIHGEDASNRDTSDAPLWFGLACEEIAPLLNEPLAGITVDKRGRTLVDALASIAEGYLRGTPNGIRVDAASALVWSPSHFTWMDTNHPAGTPRAGYPVEIQALWVRLLRQLARLGLKRSGDSWGALAERAADSLSKYFWLEEHGYLSDVLLAKNGEPASQATPDNALRSNGLLAVSLGLLDGEHARRCVAAAARHLVVPGALRSLAPLPVSPPLPIHGSHGGLLNDPAHPYWGRYEGDEDTRRKPAYHNGTAWTWTFPTFCEALARAWDLQPEAIAAASAHLQSAARLLDDGCLGHLPEIVDGDAPHTPRGCDAQAWGVTEALRVWKLLNAPH
jgi:predicted glycogen debranching enzyme